jgi:hypothetical protein
MQTEERVIAKPIPAQGLDERHPAAVRRQEPRPEMEIPDLFGRVIFVGLGFGIALTGFMVILSILLVFIGLPFFFFGLAMMEVGLKGWR